MWLNVNQTLLGKRVIVLKRHEEQVVGLSAAEWVELHTLAELLNRGDAAPERSVTSSAAVRPCGVSLIMTGVFSGTSEHAEAWRTMLEPVHAEGGTVHFVQLTCERDELFRRITCDSRRVLDKLIDPARLTDLLDRFDMVSPAPFGQHLRLDVTHIAPSESATKIIQHYRLDNR